MTELVSTQWQLKWKRDGSYDQYVVRQLLLWLTAFLFPDSYHNDGLHTEELIVWNTANRPQTGCQWACLAKPAPKGERQSVNALINAAPFQVKHFSQCVCVCEQKMLPVRGRVDRGDNVLFSFSGTSPNHFSWFLWYLVDSRDEIHLTESHESWESPINLPSILKWCQGLTTQSRKHCSSNAFRSFDQNPES